MADGKRNGGSAAKTFAVKSPLSKAAADKASAAGGWSATAKGVVQGQAFRFDAPAPQLDKLTRSVTLAELPRTPFPQEALGIRVRRLWLGRQPPRMGREERLLWRYHDTIEGLLTLLWRDFQPQVRGFGAWLGAGKTRRASGAGIVHPYQIKAGTELLAELPETLAQERRYLDELLTMILVIYKKAISERTAGALIFHREAQEYFFSGYRMEKMMSGISDSDEAFSARQMIHDNYYHGIRYYIYALLCREELDDDNQTFMFFANALYFLARIEWNGKLVPRPTLKNLPSRQWVLFYAFRDRTVLRQYQRSPDYARQLRDMLRAFPEDVAAAKAAARAAAVGVGEGAAKSKTRFLLPIFARKEK